ncbi:MAG: hypothetical protein LAT63_00600 [Marinobacter sp.]|nr:hypothetical protein [Marinobacter sp.]
MIDSSPISFVTVRRRFDFRNIEVGRWVTEQERDRAAVNFYRALCDLMHLLQGPERLVSLRGTLGLQYGIGGRPGVSAHYIPASRQLALAKNAGAGSLAHEWFHGFDHYMGDRLCPGTGPQSFASSAWLNSGMLKQHPLNQRLAECYRVILLSENGTTPSRLFEASQRADEHRGVFYYSRPEEICARAFEAFAEDCKPTNRFLVRGTRGTDEAQAGLYPSGMHRKQVNDAFMRYFSALGTALFREQAQAG